MDDLQQILNKNKAAILHPFLFGLYPILALLSANMDQVQLTESYRSIVAILVGVAILLVLSRLLLRDWHRAAALTSLCVVLFFSYGHVYAQLKTTEIAGVLVGRHRNLLPLWAGVLALGAWLLTFRIRVPAKLTQLFNLVGAVVLIFPAFELASYIYALQSDGVAPVAASAGQMSEPSITDRASRPDIYYIVLDAYGRTDVLQERYNLDNTPFVDFLQERGFYIAERSTVNYLWTPLSLSATLNMDYLPNLDINLESGRYPGALYEPIKHSVVRQQLESRGYSTVALSTGLFATEIYDAAHFLAPDMATLEEIRLRGGYNAFEGMLIHTSAALILADLDSLRTTDWIAVRLEYPYKIQREIILAAFDNLEVIPNIPGPKFVFAHVITPHKPYIFGPNGEARTGHEPFTFAEIQPEDAWDENVPRYRDQLIYVNSRLETIVDAILSNSERPPIIIIQSDHGPGIDLDWDNPEAESVRDRIANFSAFYFPDDCDRQLYPTISTVNVFRIVFNCYFETSYPLLEDTTFYNNARGPAPYQFVQVEELLP